MRHTMGQDWGGRRKENPENCPKIDKHDVIKKASDIGINVRRGDYLQDGSFYHSDWAYWWRFDEEKNCWITLGTTNYLAFISLERLGIKNGH